MRFTMGWLGLLVAASAALGTAAQKQAQEPQPDESAEIMVYQITSEDAVTIDFAPGSSTLNEAKKTASTRS